MSAEWHGWRGKLAAALVIAVVVVITQAIKGTPLGSAVLALAVLLAFLAIIGGIACLAGGGAKIASFINRSWGV
jgi:hypothetical protein